MVYNWNCGNEVVQVGVDPEDGLPPELDNKENWFWTWIIGLSYLIGSGGWLLGYIAFIPLAIVL